MRIKGGRVAVEISLTVDGIRFGAREDAAVASTNDAAGEAICEAARRALSKVLAGVEASHRKGLIRDW